MDNLKIKPVWSKSKDELWNEKFKQLEEEHQYVPKFSFRRIPVWGYAASLLIPILLICHFYTVMEETKKGEHTVVRLPDRSTVILNAESKLSYKPVEWLITRKVTLKGEAYFDVESGSAFYVQSGQNRVQVLGTTFNVYARAELYRVSCLTGLVEVQAGRKSVMLHPNMQAVYNERQIHVYSDVAPSTANGWVQGKFSFVGTPLQEVIAEVERQYNIIVTPDYYPNHLYSGNFSKTEKPETVLEIIGKSFDIKFSIEQ